MNSPLALLEDQDFHLLNFVLLLDFIHQMVKIKQHKNIKKKNFGLTFDVWDILLGIVWPKSHFDLNLLLANTIKQNRKILCWNFIQKMGNLSTKKNHHQQKIHKQIDQRKSPKFRNENLYPLLW